jgi:Pyruvate/2-oxoacid:ferredoxin oxidoreductase gamma subunit
MKHPHSTNGAQHALTQKQLRFVQEYLLDCNATAAYKRAGYQVTSDTAAQAAASRLLKNPKVAEAIDVAKKARGDRTEITIDFVVQETLANYRRCVEAEEFAAANKALELLGRHIGAFPNKCIIGGSKNDPIPIRFMRFVRVEPRAEQRTAPGAAAL